MLTVSKFKTRRTFLPFQKQRRGDLYQLVDVQRLNTKLTKWQISEIAERRCRDLFSDAIFSGAENRIYFHFLVPSDFLGWHKLHIKLKTSQIEQEFKIIILSIAWNDESNIVYQPKYLVVFFVGSWYSVYLVELSFLRSWCVSWLEIIYTI